MSLQVWMPLTKDLRNQGLSGVTITNEGATFESSGKLGGCYNLTNGPIVISNLPNPQAISIAFWFKRIANTGTRQFMFTAWTGVTCELTTDGKPTFAVNRSSYPTITGDAITTSSGWVHYCGTFSQTEGMKLYINGSLVASNSNTSAIVWGTTTGQIGKYSNYASMSAQMNDFRIYDHCLSEAEIKKLAQGLILHYPLNRGGWGQENLSTNTSIVTKFVPSGTNSWCTPVGAFVSSNDGLSIVNNSTTNSIFTLSFDYTVTGVTTAATNVGPSLRHTSSSYTNPTWISGAALTIPTGTSSGHFQRSFKLVEGQITYGDRWLFSSLGSDTVNRGIEWTITNFKFEVGDKATPWCPNVSDELATSMGLNDNTEYDISGFCNNGMRVGTFEWTSDTPKYEVSTEFQNGTAATISPIFSSTTRHKQLTFAAWIKRSSDDANYHYYWSNGGVRLGIRAYNNVNNYYWISWTHATDDAYEDHGWVSTVMPKDTWIHIAWVFDSGIWKQYVNGVLNGTRNDSSYGTYIYGDVGSVLGNSWIGNVSDVRIYATALSAADVKSLYQNCATIAADGTIYGQIRS